MRVLLEVIERDAERREVPDEPGAAGAVVEDADAGGASALLGRDQGGFHLDQLPDHEHRFEPLQVVRLQVLREDERRGMVGVQAGAIRLEQAGEVGPHDLAPGIDAHHPAREDDGDPVVAVQRGEPRAVPA